MQGPAVPFPVVRPLSLRRRRFLMVSIAMLGVLGIALGVSFAQTTGTATPGVTGGATQWVFPVVPPVGGNPGGAVPDGVTALRYTPTAGINATTDLFTASVKLPSWTPIQDAAGTVTSSGGGDLALIDARNQSLLVSVYITNLHQLQQAYSSYAFQTNVWRCASSCTVTGATTDEVPGSWQQAPVAVVPQGPPAGSLLTNTEGFMQYQLASGFHYVITFDAGGTFFAFNTANSTNLSPTFFFSAQAI